MSSVKVSIIIPVRDDVVGLEITLNSLRDSIMFEEGIEIIVCNDGGGSAVSEIARRFNCLEANLAVGRGSYAARNAGVHISQGDVLVFLDADQRVDAEWLRNGLDALLESDYVGGMVKVELPADADVWERYDGRSSFPVKAYLDEMHFAPTANLFIKKLLYHDVGPFKDDLFSGGDREFGVRVHRAGYRQSYCPSAITYHPCRNRKEQFKKIRRVGSGMVDVKLGYWGQSPIYVFVSSSMRFFKVIPELLWRLSSGVIQLSKSRSPDELAFVLIGKVMKAAFFWWVSARAAAYLIRVRSLRKSE